MFYKSFLQLAVILMKISYFVIGITVLAVIIGCVHIYRGLPPDPPHAPDNALALWTEALTGRDSVAHREKTRQWIEAAIAEPRASGSTTFVHSIGDFLKRYPQLPDEPLLIFSQTRHFSGMEEWFAAYKTANAYPAEANLKFRAFLSRFAEQVRAFQNRYDSLGRLEGPYARNARDLLNLQMPEAISPGVSGAHHPFFVDSDFEIWQGLSRFLLDLRSEFENINRIQESMSRERQPPKTALEIARFASGINYIQQEVHVLTDARNVRPLENYLKVVEVITDEVSRLPESN